MNSILLRQASRHISASAPYWPRRFSSAGSCPDALFHKSHSLRAIRSSATIFNSSSVSCSRSHITIPQNYYRGALSISATLHRHPSLILNKYPRSTSYGHRKYLHSSRSLKSSRPPQLSTAEKVILATISVGIALLAFSFGVMVLVVVLPFVAIFAVLRYARNRFSKATSQFGPEKGLKGFSSGVPKGFSTVPLSSIMNRIESAFMSASSETFRELVQTMDTIQRDITAKVHENRAAIQALGPRPIVENAIEVQQRMINNDSMTIAVFPIVGTRGTGKIEVLVHLPAFAGNKGPIDYQRVVLHLRDGTILDLTDALHTAADSKKSGGQHIIEAEFREKP